MAKVYKWLVVVVNLCMLYFSPCIVTCYVLDVNVFVVGVLCTGKVDAAGEAHGWQGGEGLHHGGEGEEEGGKQDFCVSMCDVWQVCIRLFNDFRIRIAGYVVVTSASCDCHVICR